MATFYDDMEEIRHIILDIPHESDGCIQSWEDIDEDSDDLPEAENSYNQPFTDVSTDSGQMSNSQNRVAAPSRTRVAQQREKVPEINWGHMDEVTNVKYPEFLGPKHGPIKDFVDSEPVIFFGQMFTDKIWDLLVTETNRYTRQDIFVGFLFGTFINKIRLNTEKWLFLPVLAAIFNI